MADRLFTSSGAYESLSALRYDTKLEKSVLARMAFSLSLATQGADVSPNPDFGGSEIKRPTFVGTDEVFMRALIASVYGQAEISEDEFYSNKSIIKYHIDNGSALLQKLFIECGRDASRLIAQLVDTVEFEGRKEFIGKGLEILIGKQLLNKQEVVLELNDTAKHANSHLAIMGKPGVGKTHLVIAFVGE